MSRSSQQSSLHNYAQTYLERCKQIQRQANSDPSYHQPTFQPEESPSSVIVISDDNDNPHASRDRHHTNLPTYLQAMLRSSAPITSQPTFNRENGHSRFPNRGESTDLHITGEGVLKEWIDISELDLKKHQQRSVPETGTSNPHAAKARRKITNGSRAVRVANRDGTRRIEGVVAEKRSDCDIRTVNNVENSDAPRTTEGEKNRHQNDDPQMNGGDSSFPRTFEATDTEEAKGSGRKKDGNGDVDPNWADLYVEEDVEVNFEPKVERECENRQPEPQLEVSVETKAANFEPEDERSRENRRPEPQLEVSVETKSANFEPEEERERGNRRPEPQLEVQESSEPRLEAERVPEERQPRSEEVARPPAAGRESTEKKGASKKAKYRCEHCPYATDWKSNLTKHHVSRHQALKEIRWYECAHCPYRGKTREYLRSHLRQNHEQFITWHSCPRCPHKFTSSQQLKNHTISIHTPADQIEWQQCDLCEFKCKFKPTLKEHRLRKHTAAGDIPWAECDLCPFKSKLRAGVLRHQMKMHPDPARDRRGFTCPTCDFVGATKAALTSHVRATHADPEDDLSETVLECKQCGVKMMSKSKFRQHYAWSRKCYF